MSRTAQVPETMRVPRSSALWIIPLCYLILGLCPCVAFQKKATCKLLDGRADCSHLGLSAVPSDLPSNITSLDMSHNTLARILPESLNRFSSLLQLDVSYNSITKLDGLCQSLPLLQTLNLEHNEVHLLKEDDMTHCTGLIWLSISSNRLKLQGEPFSTLQGLKSLDVSNNKLLSAKLGSKPQLRSLVKLNLGRNDFTTLTKEDFSFLNLSCHLEVLILSSLPLKTLGSGCFKPISGLRTLVLDGSIMDSLLISKLCSELSGTAIDALSLQKTKMVSLKNTTFTGLQRTNLTSLDLSNNGMVTIEEGSFQWLPQLQSLILSDNSIKHLTRGTFQGLKMIKTLQLTGALVKGHKSSPAIIDDFVFQPLNTLESLILQRNAFEIREHTFTGLTGLTELDISWRTYTSPKIITDKTFASLAGSPLRKLNLMGNALAQISPQSFSALRNLTTLLLNNNFLKQILIGSEFEGLASLQELHMTNNIQSVNLTSSSFVHVPSLRVLTLGKCLTAESLNRDPSPFRPLSNLTVLDLSNNNIANIRENMLEGLGNLRVLKLQHNNLARLWKMANLGGPVLFLKHVPQLVTLQMDYNGLDEIPMNALSGLKSLKELSLSNNLINYFKYPVFDDLTSLRVLRLEKNLITSVRPEVFKIPMSNLSVLVMAKNPFDCTCESILWFVTWLNNTNMTSVPGLNNQYMCNTPLIYFKHPILDFDALSCKDMTPFQTLYILSSTAVLILMSVAFLARFQGWRIVFYWNILINRTLGFSDAKVEEGRCFEYDAYIIHAQEDASWVERSLVPLENEQCQFCFEDRDSIAGMSVLDSIVDNMKNSRKILFVVTESLLRNPWCRRFQVHQALHQVIEASRDSVVLVFLQDVHDYKLSRSLFLRRGMLRPSCIVDWPVQKERVPAFHQKLLIALSMTNRLPD
ncbi:toll-like receptor 3 isoform 1-T1 [Menidia menidia]